jgi:thiol-disulfide isomerase/thioredoxin
VRKLDGGALRLSELRGQPVWLNFWASWCVPCRAEMPDLAVVGPEAERRGVRLVAINAGERPEVARAFIEGAGLDSLPVALDPDGEATAAYRLYSFPTHVFIDSDGVIREVTVRLLNAADMRQAVARLQ